MILTFASFQFCSCKNTCSKRSGRKCRGFPCRDEELKCAGGCSCGTKKESCKNKPVQQATEAGPNAGKNAFERHQIATEKAKLEITVNILQHFISIQFLFLLYNSTIILFHHSYIFFFNQRNILYCDSSFIIDHYM